MLSVLRPAAVALVVAAALLASPVAQAGTSKVSVGPEGEQADAESYGNAISRTGRFVAFASEATNLVPNDTNGSRDVFVRDLREGRTVRITPAAGLDPRGAGAPSMSASGRLVAYTDDDKLCSRVWTFDRKTGRRRLVPMTRREPDPSRPRWDVLTSALSPDGRYVAMVTARTHPGESCQESFESEDGPSDNSALMLELFDRRTGKVRRVPTGGVSVVPYATIALAARARAIIITGERVDLDSGDRTTQLYALDPRSGRRTRVDVDSRERRSAGYSELGDVSHDGRFVAFVTRSSLVPGDSGEDDDVYLRDRRRGVTTRASIGSGGAGLGNSYAPSLSADGRVVAFVAGDTPSVVNDVFVRDRRTRRTRALTSHGLAAGPGVSGDGRSVVFGAAPGGRLPTDPDGFFEVFVNGPFG
jgi:Tol biopolymer transport system component